MTPAQDTEHEARAALAMLHVRMTQWAHAYGGSQHVRYGHCPADRLRRPQPCEAAPTEARETDDLITGMERLGFWREARVLRAEYFLPALSETERLERLRRIGLPLSRTTYYALLQSARAFLLGATQVAA